MSSTPQSIARVPRPDTVVLRRILEAGLQAPSAENRHYLRFETLPAGVRLVSTDTPSWAALPHRQTLALVALGAVAENLALRAAACGHPVALRWHPEPGRPEVIADLEWSAQPAAVDPLEASIEARHTNRRFYRLRRLDDGERRPLSHAAAAVPGAALQWLDDPAQRAWALKAIRIAESERFCRRELHHELFSAVRFELGWRRSAPDGLPPGSLEVELPMRPLFAALRRWPLMHTLSLLGMHHVLGQRAAALPCRLAPQLGLVLCDGPSEAQRAFGAGRALQRVWLAATAQGLAFQPMAAATVLLRQRAVGDWIRPAVRDRLHELLQHATAGRASAAYMFFRVGHAAEPSLVTGRPAPDMFISTNPSQE